MLTSSSDHLDKKRYLGMRICVDLCKECTSEVSQELFQSRLHDQLFFSALHICTGCSTTAAAGFLPSLNWMIFSSNWEKSFLAPAASGRKERNETIHCNRSHNHPIERFICKTTLRTLYREIKCWVYTFNPRNENLGNKSWAHWLSTGQNDGSGVIKNKKCAPCQSSHHYHVHASA